MPLLKNLRFNKLDVFGHPLFIADSEKEPKNYNKLKKIYKQLKTSYPDLYLPIFTNEQYKYSSLRLKIHTQITKLKLKRGDTVNVKFSIKHKKTTERESVICHCDIITLVKRAEPIDHGDDVKIDESDSECEDMTGGHSVNF